LVFGLLYKLLWGAAVLVDIDDEELLFVGEREPITLDGLKRLCHRPTGSAGADGAAVDAACGGSGPAV
jgi:hypothetical protein